MKKGNYFRWEFTYYKSELLKMVNEKTGQSFENISSIDPIQRGVSGRIIKLKISWPIKEKTIILF